MKKILCLVITIFAVITLFSCGGEQPKEATPNAEPNTPEVITPEVVTSEPPAPPEDIEWQSLTVEERQYECTGFGSFDYDKKWYVFNSRQELDAFYEKGAFCYGDEFIDFCKKYDDAYFADRSLVCVYFSSDITDKRFGGATQFMKGESKYYLTVMYKIRNDEIDPDQTYNPVWNGVTLLSFYEPEVGCKFDESDFTLYWEEGYFEIKEGYPE